MRFILVPIINLILLAFALLGFPFRAMRVRNRPKWVQFKLKGDPPYRPAPKPRWRFGNKPEEGTVTSLDLWATQLTELGADSHVKGALVEVESLTAGASKREAIAALFKRFRQQGKQVVVYAVSADTPTYELLAQADRVLMAPAGQLQLVGYSAEATALAGGLDRVGVRAHFIRRGEHKTAPELFTHHELSDIQRQTIEGLLDVSYAALVDSVSNGRNLARDRVTALVNVGPYSARGAAKEGLTDGTCHEVDLPYVLEGKPVPDPEAQSSVKAKDTDASPTLGSYPTYRSRTLWPPRRFKRIRRPTRLAIVNAHGMIVDGVGGGNPLGPQAIGGKSLVKSLKAAGADRRCPAILLHIDSPGGSAIASELALEELQRVARKKPVIAFFDRVAASGGYMLAIGAKEIWSTPRAIAGSIGVFAGKFEVSELLERIGIHRSVLTRGDNAGLSSSTRGFTETERAALERSIEETYQAFLSHVAKARQMTVSQVHQLGEGRIYTGKHALEVGLVDRIGSFEDACRRALEVAGKSTGSFELKTFQSRRPRLLPLQMMRSMIGTQLYAVWEPALFTSLGRSDL